MKKDDIKKKAELYVQARKVIESLGYEPSMDMCAEAPDIILPSNIDKQIGIEVTEYLRSEMAKNDDSLYKVLKQYTQRLDKKTEKRYIIDVEFAYGERPTNINYNSIKEELFDEIDRFIFHSDKGLQLKYIDDVSYTEVPGMNDSFASIGAEVYEYGETDEKLLLDCIKKKEIKLSKYKALQENQTIKEYYLVIYASRLEHPEVRDYDLPKGFTTDYDRIYFVDDFEMKRLK